MIVKQFEYKPLSHFSYALISDDEMALVDPERDPSMYYAFAKANKARIIAVIETHPHADFVSSHLQIHVETGAIIYSSKKIQADYPHKSFDDGDQIQIGAATLSAINTPGHSPDSITIVAQNGEETVLFTGDTLFIGDVGRPDLREKAGNMRAKREELAGMMYDTIRNAYNHLPDEAVVYPAHGAGSLCGKNLSDASSSTLGEERRTNWAFQSTSKADFLNTILEGQPFIPHYFGYNVDLNKSGVEAVQPSIDRIPISNTQQSSKLVVDARNSESFKSNHIKGSINIQATSETSKFATWLGSVVRPDEYFSLVIDQKQNKDSLLHRAAKIGYEKIISNVIIVSDEPLEKSKSLDLDHFSNHQEQYTIIDIRNESEIEDGKIFDTALAHPLHSLRTSAKNIPTDKPIVVHCAGGYRSATGSSILEGMIEKVPVYDLSDDISKFK